MCAVAPRRLLYKWDRWYLPSSLFKFGNLRMYIASFKPRARSSLSFSTIFQRQICCQASAYLRCCVFSTSRCIYLSILCSLSAALSHARPRPSSVEMCLRDIKRWISCWFNIGFMQCQNATEKWKGMFNISVQFQQTVYLSFIIFPPTVTHTWTYHLQSQKTYIPGSSTIDII